jgi:hypothetical protein
MSEVRVYANRGHILPNNHMNLNDLCRVLWSGKNASERLQQYGSRARYYRVADSPQSADIYVLPLLWNYYRQNGLHHQVDHEIQEAAKHGYHLIIFSEGDFPANLPFGDVILFERAGYASRRNLNGCRVYALPAVIDDYVHLYCQGQPVFRQKKEIPVVGFCGQAAGYWFDFARREGLRRWRKARFILGSSPLEPPPYETTLLRKRILSLVGKYSGLKTNYLLRTRYRAGYLAPNKDPFHPSRLEFIKNILESDYTVCIRGGGNFSVRFYETLSLGRIPVFVNTDCILPFDDQLNYRQCCVWVEQDDIPYIGEIIEDFHASHTPAQFRELQEYCRELWLNWLSSDGFYQKLPKHLLQIRQVAA